MRDFCSRMRSKSSEIRQAGADIAGDKGVSSGVKGFSRSDTNVLITGWDRQKTALFAFLYAASSILQVLLQDDPPQRYDSADMATEVLLTLSSFSDLTDSSNGGFEGYDKVFYGCLDVLAARGGTNGVKRLFDRLFDQGVMSDHKAGFILVVGEQVVHHLDGKSLGIVMGLCQRWL